MRPSTRLVLRTAAQTRGSLVGASVLLAGSFVAALLGPTLLADAADAVLTGSDAVRPALLLAAVVAAGLAIDLSLGLLGAATTGHGVSWLQGTLVRHLLSLGSRSSLPVGDAAARLAQGAAGVAGLPLFVLQQLATLSASSVALVALWLIDWRAGLTLTLALPVAVVLARRFVAGTTEAQTQYLVAQSGIAARLLAALAGARTIRAAATVPAERSRVLGPLPDLSAAGHRLWRLQRGAVWQFGLLIPLAELLVLAVAGIGIASGRNSPSDLLAVIGYLAIAVRGLEQIDGLLQVASVRAGANRMAEILAQPVPASGNRRRPWGPGWVTLRDVTVRRNGDPLLDHLYLTVPAGQSLALVGPSGAGKSLTAALIGRLIDADGGTVRLDGVPVEQLDPADLRSTVSYAFEKPELVGTTVRDAIAYGWPDPSTVDVKPAARAAGADAFIRRLPRGYDTPLAETPLSGGERQRLGLARALARPAQIYVFDDATAGLDTITEAEVTETITTLLNGRTRVIIAHRASTAARCDLVAWLSHGRVVAVGTHDRLWSNPGYRAVFGQEPVATRGMEPAHA